MNSIICLFLMVNLHGLSIMFRVRGMRRRKNTKPFIFNRAELGNSLTDLISCRETDRLIYLPGIK